MSKSRIEGMNIKKIGIDGIIQRTESTSIPELQKEDQTSRINFDVTASLKERLQIHCVKNKVSLKDFITNAILVELNIDKTK